MPTLPSGLAPISSKYTSDDPGGVMRTEVAGGAPRYALDWDRGMQRYTISFAMEKEMYQVWVLFYFHIIKKGAITFDMPLDSGFGMSPHSVNIIPGTYATAHAGGTSMIVSFVVDAESQAYGYGVSDAQGMIDVWEAYGLAADATLARLTQFALYDTLALVFPAPVYSGPSLDLDFANQLYRTGDWLPEYEFSDLITFTRSTTGTRTGPTGLIETVAINAPRIDYDPLTGECKGLLIEEARTNLLTYSDQFDNAAWTKSSSTVTPNAALAPDGTMTADKLINGAGASLAHSINQTVASIAASTTSTATVFAQAAELRYLQMRVTSVSSGSNHYRVVFDVLTGVITETVLAGTATGGVASIEPVGGGRYRCRVSVAPDNVAGTGTKFELYTMNAPGGTAVYTGDGTSGIYIWGAQLEAGSFPTSYIPTVASQVARAADNASMTGANFSSWYRQDEGSLSVKFTSGYDLSSTRVISIDNGISAADAIGIIGSNSGSTAGPYFSVGVGNAAQCAITDGAETILTSHSVSAAYKTNDFAYVRDGRTVLVDTLGAIPSTARMLFGMDSAGNWLNGHISKLSYFPRRLDNATLQALTS